MKDTELKVVVELMKNSRRSDRELARAIGMSQPTVTRTRTGLEKQGIIKEYTMVPDYVQLGFQLMSITFTRLKEPISKETLEEVRKSARKTMSERPTAVISATNGLGCNADHAVIAFHRDYAEYCEFMNLIRQRQIVAVDEVKSFIGNLFDKNQFQSLSFSKLAEYLAKTKESARA
jgi:DNA-binding Lrp family transcriptional regulator